MPSLLELTTLAAAIIGIVGNILFVARTYGKLEEKVAALERDMNDDKQAQNEIVKKIDSIVVRVQAVETKVATIEVKLDNVKESITDLKKILLTHQST